MLAVVVLVAGLVGIGAWLALRRRRLPAAVAVTAVPLRAAPAQSIDGARLELSNAQASERLWKLAFASPSQPPAADAIRQKMRDNIVGMLEADALDPNYFPRRPTLMPQLLQAVNDPTAAAERISRIIAHDPVLTGDVLRLANSSIHRSSPVPIDSILPQAGLSQPGLRCLGVAVDREPASTAAPDGARNP